MLASADATVPPVRLVSAETIRNFLAANRVAPATGDAASTRSAVVRVICVRQ
jgi:hypothetical protein